MALAQTTSRAFTALALFSHRQRAGGSHHVLLALPSAAAGSQRACAGANADARAPGSPPAPLQEARKPASRVANVLQRESEARASGGAVAAR